MSENQTLASPSPKHTQIERKRVKAFRSINNRTRSFQRAECVALRRIPYMRDDMTERRAALRCPRIWQIECVGCERQRRHFIICTLDQSQTHRHRHHQSTSLTNQKLSSTKHIRTIVKWLLLRTHTHTRPDISQRNKINKKKTNGTSIEIRKKSSHSIMSHFIFT